ncbi:hypothetical protein [Marinomonas ostreistagni]|uniref:hypothetical protein n=1 Tax=Marinomonas ostreistagni TaxID=359209 RepID=UPI00194E3A81|nr:hypothetical protein [Marinomonas ostreistagni]MBM6551198.1 hypothetical protein [Marinomonas ostreistagni]
MYEEAGNTNLVMLLNTAIYPFLAAALLALLGKIHQRLSVLGLAAGFLVGLNLIHSGLNFPPSKALDFLVITVLLGCLASLLKTLSARWQTSWLTLLLLSVSFYLLLNPVLQHQNQLVSISWAIAAGVIAWLVMSCQNITAEAKTSHAPTASLAVVAAVSAPVVSIGGSLLIGQLLGVFAASMAAAILVQRFVLKQSSLTLLLPGTFVLAGLLAQAHVLADLPLWVVLVSYVALLTNALSNLIWREDGRLLSPLKTLLPQVLLSAVIAAVALWSVWPESSLY